MLTPLQAQRSLSITTTTLLNTPYMPNMDIKRLVMSVPITSGSYILNLQVAHVRRVFRSHKWAQTDTDTDTDTHTIG